MTNLRGITRVTTFGLLPNVRGILTCPSVNLPLLTVNGNVNLKTIYFNAEYISKLYFDGVETGMGISSNQMNLFNPTTSTAVFSCGINDILSVSSTGFDISYGHLTYTDLDGISIGDPPIVSEKYAWDNTYISFPFNTNFYWDCPLPTGHRWCQMQVNFCATVNGLEWPHIKFISGTTVYSTNYFGVTQGSGTVSDHSSGRGIDLWQNSWSSSHTLAGTINMRYAGVLEGASEPAAMWIYWGTIARTDATFQTTIGGTFLCPSTVTINKIRIQTNAATDRFGWFGAYNCDFNLTSQ